MRYRGYALKQGLNVIRPIGEIISVHQVLDGYESRLHLNPQENSKPRFLFEAIINDDWSKTQIVSLPASAFRVGLRSIIDKKNDGLMAGKIYYINKSGKGISTKYIVECQKHGMIAGDYRRFKMNRSDPYCRIEEYQPFEIPEEDCDKCQNSRWATLLERCSCHPILNKTQPAKIGFNMFENLKKRSALKKEQK